MRIRNESTDDYNDDDLNMDADDLMIDYPPRSLTAKVLDGFHSLKSSPSELWKAYLLKFLDSYSYFSFSIIFVLFMSHDFGYTDVEAGLIYGLWGALITVYGLITGSIVDNLGVAKSLRLGFVLSLIARIGILLTTSRKILLLHVCVILPLGNCMGIPVLTTGIRRYTNESNRGFAFGLFYVIMNVAALLAGPIVDMCTILHKDGDEGDDETQNNSEQTYDGWELTGYRMVVLTGVVANVIAVLVTLTVREIKVDTAAPDDGLGRIDSPGRPQRKVSAFTPIQGNYLSILKDTIYTKRFWRFLVVCMITLNVRMIFRHLDATWPKYMIREFGENVPKGTIYSINPAFIIILVPLVTAATSKIDPLLMIHHGSYVSSLSVFFLVISTSLWSSTAFVVLLSIGESIWSPRLYDYTMSVSKEGREGTYMALSAAPLFLAKLPVGVMSGWLLETYCPETGTRNSQMMWLIIGLTTISSPIFMTVFWKYISYKDLEEVEERNTQYTELQGNLQKNKITDI